MKEEKMTYETFSEELQKVLSSKLPRGTQLKVSPILKNNSLHLDGLLICQKNSPLSPNFYLQDLYQKYLHGNSIHALVSEVYEGWQNTLKQKWGRNLDMSYENCRKHIVYRLVSAERNKELLETIPHIPFLDLAVVFYYLVNQDEEGIGSIRISNELMERWNVSTEELMEEATRNTPALFPAKCNPMSSILEKMIFHMEEKERMEYVCSEPYVLTNSNGINGASVWLYPDQLKNIANFFGKSFYILPSSIHEVLVLAESNNSSEEELISMVREVNQSCVECDEILSDNIYYYDDKKEAVRVITSSRSSEESRENK